MAVEAARDDVERRLVQSIATLNGGLRASAENTRAVEAALGKFESKVGDLERVVAPIHSLTERLSLARANIDATLVHFEKLDKHFRVADDARLTLENGVLVKSDAPEDRRAYFDAVEKLCKSYDFLQTKPEFKSTSETVGRLSDLRRFALDNICIAFEVLLERNAATTMDYVGPQVDPENPVEDAIELHESLPFDIAVHLQELGTCVENCNLSGLLVDTYAKSRGRVITDAFDELLNFIWAEDAAKQQNLPEKLSSFVLRGEQASFKSKSAATFQRNARGDSMSMASGHVPQLLGKNTSFSVFRGAARGIDRAADSDGGSAFESIKSKTSKWKSKLHLPRRRKNKAGLSDSGDLEKASVSQSRSLTPSPPSSVTSMKSNKKMKSTVIIDAFPGKRYVAGEHPMVEMLSLGAYVFEAEAILSGMALPPGRAGRWIFLEAMIGPCENFARIGMKDMTEYTQLTYSKTEAMFAYLDTLERMQHLKKRFHQALAPNAPIKDGRRNRDSLSLNPKETEYLPAQAWDQIMLMYTSWRNLSIKSLRNAYTAVVDAGGNIPDSASVHPATSRFVNFVRRLAGSKRVVQSLLSESISSGEGTSSGLRNVDEEFRENMEGLIDTFISNLRSIDRGIIGWPIFNLFVVNNLAYIVQETSSDEGPFGETLYQSNILKQKKADLDQAKTDYVSALLQPVRHIIINGELNSLDIGKSSLPSSTKKILKDQCGILQEWIDDQHRKHTKLEVPDYELRAELRFRIRREVVEPYAEIYSRVASSPYVERKGKENFLKFDPEVLSAMVSQFFEISETTSNPRALPQ